MPHPGKDRLLLHQAGACPGRTRKRRFERAVQRLDPARHVDVAKIPAPKIFESLGGAPPCVDEGAQFNIRVVGHIGAWSHRKLEAIGETMRSQAIVSAPFSGLHGARTQVRVR